MDLIDIGANLAHDSFDEDRNEVLDRAAAADVSRIIITGSSYDSNAAALDLAVAHPGRLFATAGMHPHHASDYDERCDQQIRVLAQRPQCVAIGECGLDYFRNFSPRAAQRSTLSAQLNIAIDTGLPLFLHQRDAHEDFIDLLEPQLGKVSRAVAHCFTGDATALNDYLSMGLYLGITGWICDERRGKDLYELVASIPDDRLMIETDAPYLLPRTLRPKPKSRRNEPAFLPEVLKVLAEARGQSIADVANFTRENAIRFFDLP
ncbi:MAG TPA: TatD family hydrolase [Woeseiaceae bacterium]|nr:TatD family hydrolase [Woeseiaceae bacterium]